MEVPQPRGQRKGSHFWDKGAGGEEKPVHREGVQAAVGGRGAAWQSPRLHAPPQSWDEERGHCPRVIRVMAQDVVWQLAGLMLLNICFHVINGCG